jgi:hypothetical protein
MKKQVTLIVALVVIAFSYGQKMKVVNGGFDFIKDQKEVNVEFVYDNLTLYKDNRSNQQYVEERTAELEEKSRGRGKAWGKKWESSKELIYQPKFLELVNKYLSNKKGIYFSEELPEAKYTLIVDVVWIYPGYNVGVMRKGAKLSTNLKFVETANRENVVLEMTAKNAPGDRYGGSFSNEDRIGEGFAKTGKTLAGLVLKKAF